MLKQKTLTMAANTGYVIQIDGNNPFGSVSIRSTAVCFVRLAPYNPSVGGPVTPGDPTPAPGQTCDYYKMAANEVKTFGVEAALGVGAQPTFSDTISYVIVYSTAVGDLAISAH